MALVLVLWYIWYSGHELNLLPFGLVCRRYGMKEYLRISDNFSGFQFIFKNCTSYAGLLYFYAMDPTKSSIQMSGYGFITVSSIMQMPSSVYVKI